MKRLLTNHNIMMLDQELDGIVDAKNIIKDLRLNIIGGSVNDLTNGDTISVDQIEVELGRSDLADSITIDTTGRVYINGDNYRLASPFVDELVTIAQLGMRLRMWFNDLPTETQE